MIPPDLSETDYIPGSLLSHASAFASPDTFVWSRLMDAAMSVGDLRALDVHARVERWALDEAPLPGRLVHQITDGTDRAFAEQCERATMPRNVAEV